MHGANNTDVSGDYLYNSANCHNSYLLEGDENCRYTYYALNSKDYYDVTVSPNANELIYESHAIPNNNYFLRFCDLCSNGNKYLQYCSHCDASSYLFGCIGLRGQQYCIFNKQYTKEEYEALVPKIIEHMNQMPYVDAKGHEYCYGEFFPLELSPFGYNQDFRTFPLDPGISPENSWILPKSAKVLITSRSRKIISRTPGRSWRSAV